ncbi:MAG: hypothetical protein WA108_01475 [Thiobacillus sp.]
MLAIAQKQKKQELREKINHVLKAENEQFEREVRHRTEELTNLATYLTEVRETEKLHLAREMHGELGALLTPQARRRLDRTQAAARVANAGYATLGAPAPEPDRRHHAQTPHHQRPAAGAAV